MCIIFVHWQLCSPSRSFRPLVLYLWVPPKPMNRLPRVLLLIPHLGGGGAEQVTAMLAQGFARKKYELHLGIVTGTAQGPERLPSPVAVHALGARSVRAGAFRLLRLIRNLKPDLILSGMAHLNFLVLLLRPLFPQGTRVLVRQNGTASAALASRELPAYTRLLYRLTYPHADCVICQTPAMAADLAAVLGTTRTRMAVLNNPIQVDRIRTTMRQDPAWWTGPGPHLLAVGRLSREKGFDLLVQALAVIREQLPNADLLIAGSGPEETALKLQCRRLGLEAAVRFPGNLQDPSECFPGASVFVLSSRHEGMPNALLEAAAGGLPIVALPASLGVVDLLRGQPGVWLASEISAAALASALLTALRALQPGERFAHAFIEPFRFERAIRAYQDLIDATLNHPLG